MPSNFYVNAIKKSERFLFQNPKIDTENSFLAVAAPNRKKAILQNVRLVEGFRAKFFMCI